MQEIDVALIQRDQEKAFECIIRAPRSLDGAILLDYCPRGTHSVKCFNSVKAAADYMEISEEEAQQQYNNLIEREKEEQA